jgi:carbon-monoxide dehydrogenase large subunit
MRLIGTSIQRVEDARVLTGRGHYVDDVNLVGMLHAAFVRSPHPHARITRLNVSAAQAMPGVVAVLTGADMQRLTKPISVQTVPGFRSPAFHPLATDRVRFVGDPIAIIVADSRYVAEDARDVVEVDYEPLEPVVTIEHALDSSRPALFEELGGNILFQDSHTYGDAAKLG